MKRHLLIAMLGAASLTAFADYEINFPEGTNQTATNPPRYLTGVRVSTGVFPEQTLNVGQQAGGPLYIDKSKQCIMLMAGVTTKIDFNWAGNWLNSYVYLDRGNDGRFDATISDVGVPAEGSDIMSFSNLANINSAGGEAVDNRNILGNTMILPEFTVPALEPGLYRMRFKVDFNSVDPGGYIKEGESGTDCASRGGTIADAMALIVKPLASIADLRTEAVHGTITVTDSDDHITITATPDEDFTFTGIEIINAFDIPATYTLADPAAGAAVKVTADGNTVTVAKSGLTASSLVRAIFENEKQNGSNWDYPSANSGTKDEGIKGISAVIFNGSKMETATDRRHFFTGEAFNLQAGMPFTVQADYNGSASQFKVYVDASQYGEFGQPLAQGTTIASLGEISLPAGTSNGVYRARLEAEGDCDVDFLINVYNPTVSYRPNALNGIILSQYGSPMAETVSAMRSLTLQVKPTLEGFAVDTVIVRHGQNIFGEEFIYGNRQWTDDVFDIVDNKVTIPAEAINGDICVYALFSETPDSEWIKIWGDEFNSGAIDSNRWQYQPRSGATWNKRCANTPAQQALVNKVSDGYYNSWCIPTPDDIKAAGETQPMISGAIISSGKFSTCFGKIEARAKTTKHIGNFPAFWMMPAYSELGSIGLSGWPNDGEIDIWETIDTQNIAHTTVHSGWTGWQKYHNPSWPQPAQQSPQSSTQTACDNDLWHVYALEWDAEELRWFIDGKQVFSYKNQHYTEPGSKYYVEKVTWPFDKEFYVILNQSVGDGAWARPADTSFSYLTQFDYVRVYQKKGGKHTSAIEGNGDDPDFYVPATGMGDDSSIEEIESGIHADGPAEYFDLAGRRVATSSATPGIYIERKGSKATKIIIR